MTGITPLPALDRFAVTFKADVDDYFLNKIPAFGVEATALQVDVTSKQVTASAAASTATTEAGIATTKAGLTAADAIATAADRAQTGIDAASASASAASAAAIAGAFVGTSASSVVIGIGSKTFTTQSGEQYTSGIWMTSVSQANPANWMFGQVLSYSGTALVIDVQAIGGGGTYAGWNLSLTGARGAAGPQGPAVDIAADVHAATAKTMPVTADEVPLLDSAAAFGLKKLSLSSFIAPSLFHKSDSLTPVFIKTGANTISIKAGTSVIVADTLLSWPTQTAVIMPTLTAGADYAIYACTDGSVRADSSWSAPTGYTTANSRLIGGFHYGLVVAGTTVAGGSFATTGNGMIWTQGDVDKIAGINQYSIWDLKWRSTSTDLRAQKGFSYSPELNMWLQIYIASTDTDTNGLSKAGSNIASGTVRPKIPAAFGGNGTATYPSLNWWVANDLARAYGCRLLTAAEFAIMAFGVTENQSIDATASTYPATQRNAGYTSKYGIEQASGHHWIWGEDSNFYSEVASPVGSWKDVNGDNGAGTGRGQDYTFGTYGLSRVILGGARTYGANSGSRASFWSSYPWNSNWLIGVRAACDHLRLD